MKNRQLVILLSILLFSAGIVLFPSYGFSQEKSTVEGMVQIDRNHLYMIAIGSDHGVAKGDIVEIYRLDVKVAEARLISVLSNSSMAEMLVFINVNNVFESDTVHYASRLKSELKIKPTLSSKQRFGVGAQPDISVTAGRAQERGLLGSDTSVSRQVLTAKTPLLKEVQGLRAGMEALQEDYEGKMNAVLHTAAGGKARSVIAVEKRWRKKFNTSTKQYEEKLSEQRQVLEAEYVSEKEELERRIVALTKQMDEVGETGDKRIQQLLGDVQSSDIMVNNLRETFEKERTFEEGRWMEKIAELERRYQKQLRIQRGDYERQLGYSNKEFQNQIAEYQSQVLLLQKGNIKQLGTMGDRLKDTQKVIDSLKGDKLDLEEEASKQNHQIVLSKKKVISLRDELAKTKSAYSERIKAAKKPLETHIKELKEKLVAAQKSYENQLGSAEDQSRGDILAAKEAGFEKAAAIESKLQRALNALKGSSDDQIKELQIQLNGRDNRIDILKDKRDERKSKLEHNAKEIQQLAFSVKTLKAEFASKKASQDKISKEETRLLKKEIQQLNDEIISLGKGYERQIGSMKKDFQDELLTAKQREQQEQSFTERQWLAQRSKLENKTTEDVALIKFLNDEMAALTNDLEDREKQIVMFENDATQSKKQLGKTKDSISRKVRSAKQPLEKKIKKLNEELDVAQRSHETQIKHLQAKSKNDVLTSEEQAQRKFIVLKGKIDVLRGDSDSAIGKLQDQLTGKEFLIRTLEDTNANLSLNLQSKYNQLAKSEDSIAQLNEELTLVNRGYIEEINNLKGNSHSVIKKLRKQLTEEKSLVKSLETTNLNLSSDLIRASKQLVKRDDTIVNLDEELILVKKKHGDEIVDAQSKTINDRSASEEQWKKRLTSLEGGYQKEIDGLNGQIDDLKGSSDSTISKLHLRLTEKESLVKTLENTSSNLDSDLQRKTNRLLKAEDNLARLNEELTTANRVYAEEISGLKGDSHSMIRKLKDQLAERGLMVKSLESTNSNLSSDLQKRNDQLAKFENNVTKLNENLANTKLTYSEKIKFAKLSLEEKISELNDELMSVNRKYIEEINDLKEDNYNVTKLLKNRLVEQESLVKLLENSNEGLSSDLQKRNDQLEKFENNIAQLNDNLAETKLTYSEKINFSKLSLGEKISGLNNELLSTKRNHEEEIRKLTGSSDSAIKKMQDQLDEKESLIRSLENKNTDFVSELKRKSKQLAQLEVNIDELSEDFSDIKSSQSKKIKYAKLSLEEKINGLNRELISAQKEHREEAEDIQREARDTLLKAEVKSQDKLSDREEHWEQKIKRVQDQYRDEISSLNDQVRASRDGSDHRSKMLEDDLQKEKRAVASLKLDATNLQLDLSERDRKLAKAQDSIEELKEKLHADSFSNEKRIVLAKESMAAEIKMLRSEVAFARDNHQENVEFLKERAENNLRIAQERVKAELGASEARWKVKWVTREEEYRQELNEIRRNSEMQLSGNRGEIKRTITDLNDRLMMLKHSSDNQIKELEDELVSREYQLGLRSGEYQKRVTEVEGRWAEKLAKEQKKYLRNFEEKNLQMSEDFLREKKKLRQTVIELTDELRKMRDESSKRIAKLESDLDKREFKLGFMENSSQKSTMEIEEKWRVKLTTIEEKYKRELIAQKQDITARHAIGKEKQEAVIDDLATRIDTMRSQFRVDFALKQEEIAAELALMEGKHQKELGNIASKSREAMDERSDKVSYQKGLIDALEQEKSDLAFELKQKERESANTKAILEKLRKEAKMVEISQSERMRLSMETSHAKIDELSVQLAITKQNTLSEQMDLEDRWRNKLAKAEEGYIDRLKIQSRSLENEKEDLSRRLDASVADGRSILVELRDELQDNQTLIQMISREKHDLTAELNGKEREVVMLNEEIINLKENLEVYKGMVSSSSSANQENTGVGQSLASKDDLWYDEEEGSAEYHSIVRKAILSQFQNFDFSAYAGKAGVVKIDFELSADGSPKRGPEFIGTEDEELKGLLMQCFQDAAPFPPFPKSVKKESQRFALSVSFKN